MTTTEKLGRFDHHPDPAIDFEIEVQCLEARMFDAKGGISKPGTKPETVAAVREDIERAMTFRVGGDPITVSAKQVLRRLEAEGHPMSHQANTTVSDDTDAVLAAACRKYNIGTVARLDDLVGRVRATADVTEATFRNHTETLVELLDIIKEHWVDYDHVYSIAVQEARVALSQQAPE